MAHSSPANTPETMRAMSVRAKSADTAVTALVAANPRSSVRSRVRRGTTSVQAVTGIAVRAAARA